MIIGKKSNISFFTEGDIEHPFTSEIQQYADWLSNVASTERKSIISLTYIFCSDEYLLGINQTYLQHDYYTDIITFPYQEGDNLESDLFISLERVADNASTYGENFMDELRRVMVHGLLHLIGYGDKSESDYAIMQAKEDFYIQKWVD
mgnify:CR=1 FL=1